MALAADRPHLSLAALTLDDLSHPVTIGVVYPECNDATSQSSRANPLGTPAMLLVGVFHRRPHEMNEVIRKPAEGDTNAAPD
jgi:hypothetical protein